MENQWARQELERRRSPRLLGVWLVALAIGSLMMAEYANTPGLMEDAGPAWPGAETIAEPGSEGTLLIALHPRCSCSAATLHELRRILTGAGKQPRVEILLYRPLGAGGAAESMLEEELRRLPSGKIHADAGGEMARRFGMLTSGDVALYLQGGRLAFRGGVTAARGHEGESEGGRRLRHALDSGHAAPEFTPVFGCPIRPRR